MFNTSISISEFIICLSLSTQALILVPCVLGMTSVVQNFTWTKYMYLAPPVTRRPGLGLDAIEKICT